MNITHRGQGLASANEAWQTRRQETQGRMSLSDSFSSRFYCWMFISDLGGSTVAPFHFLACRTHSVQSPTNSLFTYTKEIKRFLGSQYELGFLFYSLHFLCLCMLSPYWILCYEKAKCLDALVSFVLQRTHLVLQYKLGLGKCCFCGAQAGEAPCTDNTTPFALIPQDSFHADCKNKPPTSVSWNSTTDKASLPLHFPTDIFCFSGEKGGVSLDSSEHSEGSGSLQAHGCYACFTASLLLTVVLLNAKRGILKH